MTNIVVLVGRVTRDPESRETNGGTTVTNLSVVTDRPARNSEGKTYKDENGFTVEDADKIKRYGCEILADKVDFLTRGASQDNKDAPDIDE